MAGAATAKPPVPHARLVQAIATTDQGLRFARDRMPKALQRSVDSLPAVAEWINNNAESYRGVQPAKAPPARAASNQAKRAKGKTAAAGSTK